MKKILIPISALLLLFLVGCSTPFVPADDSGVTDAQVQELVNANNKFAFDLYSVVGDTSGNVFYSPYSISTAMAIAYEGAKGETADEIKATMNYPELSTLRSASARMYNILNKADKEYELKTANALWAEQTYSFLPEYISTALDFYGGLTTNLDFINQAGDARNTINTWVEDQTNNRIKDLIPLGAISAITRLVITNAIYFKGTWIIQFDEDDTRDADFKISEDEMITVPMMHLSGKKARFNYLDTEELQLLEMPYEGEEISMLVLLPKNDLASISEYFSADKLTELKEKMIKDKVEVYMPKFKFDTKYSMKETLRRMGIDKAFTFGDADFSGMDGSKDLFISNVIHQAFVEVNEEGTEAAAATAITMKIGSLMDENIFRADHPFMFFIQERETGNILFMGRVVDPR